MLKKMEGLKFDIQDIQRKFNTVVKYSQKLSGEVNTDALFEDWFRNKEVYIRAWDGELIKDLGPVEFHLSEDQRIKTINNVIDQIEYLYHESGIGYPSFDFDGLVNLIIANQDSFFENLVEVNELVNNGKEIKIPKGMKLLKAFKYFCDDKDLLNDIQSIASMAIQNDKVTGTLCMSVHPLDYLSVSENAHNWRSCHALDGEYRAGNLNYMGDASTVVCYLKSTYDTKLPRFPECVKWNSKKWRMLLFFDDSFSVMMAGRQYPYFENSLLLKIKKGVDETFNTKFSGWFDSYFEGIKMESFLDEEDNSNSYEMPLKRPYLPIGGRFMMLKSVVRNGPGTLQFNDLLESSSYVHPYYSFKLLKTPPFHDKYVNIPEKHFAPPSILVGKKCYCLECNKEAITMSEAFLCKHCMIKENQADNMDEFGVCHWCGEKYVIDEGGTMYDQFGTGFDSCPNCIEEYGKRCQYCGDLFEYRALNSEGICPDCA